MSQAGWACAACGIALFSASSVSNAHVLRLALDIASMGRSGRNMSSNNNNSIVHRNRVATAEHYATIAQEQEHLRQSSAFLLAQTAADNGKMSTGMRESLQALQQSLNCALCQSITVRPVTLSCAHTFCCSCIDVYAENNWSCPSKFVAKCRFAFDSL